MYITIGFHMEIQIVSKIRWDVLCTFLSDDGARAFSKGSAHARPTDGTTDRPRCCHAGRSPSLGKCLPSLVTLTSAHLTSPQLTSPPRFLRTCSPFLRPRRRYHKITMSRRPDKNPRVLCAAVAAANAMCSQMPRDKLY